eukprot:11144283-Heterocapsa_arctica.AAC.1
MRPLVLLLLALAGGTLVINVADFGVGGGTPRSAHGTAERGGGTFGIKGCGVVGSPGAASEGVEGMS